MTINMPFQSSLSSVHFEVHIIQKGTCFYLYKNMDFIAVKYMSVY